MAFTQSLAFTLIALLALARSLAFDHRQHVVNISFSGVEISAQLSHNFGRQAVQLVRFAAAETGIRPALPTRILPVFKRQVCPEHFELIVALGSGTLARGLTLARRSMTYNALDGIFKAIEGSKRESIIDSVEVFKRASL